MDDEVASRRNTGMRILEPSSRRAEEVTGAVRNREDPDNCDTLLADERLEEYLQTIGSPAISDQIEVIEG